LVSRGGGFGGACGGVGTDGGGFVDVKEGEFVEGLAVAGEVVEVVPADGVYVGLGDFFGELGVGVVEEDEEFAVGEETLLDYLGVDGRGAEGFDLCYEIVSYSLCGLLMISDFHTGKIGKYLGVQIVYERFDIRDSLDCF
jgi:hypothetical protein